MSSAKWSTRFVLVMLGAWPLVGCERAPALTGFVAANERTVVEVQGETFLSAVVWDAGLATEKLIPGRLWGGDMFSVPPGAVPGSAHPIALENSAGRSPALSFTVPALSARQPPRIDHAMILSGTFDAAGHVEGLLYVDGANIDVGAELLVNGAVVATVAHKLLQNDLYGVPVSFLGYPIDHYLSLVAVPPPQSAGATVALSVRNLDAQQSAPFSYILPASESTLDSDGDGLLDSWELNGYDPDKDGVKDVDLATLGAKPYQRDVLLELDVMETLLHPPVPATFAAVVQNFALAPVLNPLDADGIHLVIDPIGKADYHPFVDLYQPDDPANGVVNLKTLRSAHFDMKKSRQIYHYAVWGDRQLNGSSGRSDGGFEDGGTVITGDDFVITFDSFNANYHQGAAGARSHVEILMHELGHNLGLRHGGADSDTDFFRPNSWSVMTYAWALRTGLQNATRLKRITCQPFYYATAFPPSTDPEPGGALPPVINTMTGYSQGMGATVVENNASLNEPIGVCNFRVDWNDNASMTETGVNADANDNTKTDETLEDFGTWRALRFDGPVSGGKVSFP